ncbi:MAG TPA: urate hydroxylase PuuD [Thermoanaerobaculia bacterium]
MNDQVNFWLQLAFRWIHVVAGVAWIGHLYFFNFVNAHFAKTLTADNKKLVVPELLPRALYWFRWGAAWTFITGVLLAGMVYYMGGALFEDPASGNGMVATLVLLAGLVGVYLYDVIMRSVKNVVVANTIVLVLLAIVYAAMAYVAKFNGRALYIHVGALLGTAMAFNVWMRIWPAQKKIITAIKEGAAPDADLVALAGLRSRHNTFMSVPLIFFMISNHYPTVTYGTELRDVWAAVILGVGFLATKWLYNKSAKVPGF